MCGNGNDAYAAGKKNRQCECIITAVDHEVFRKKCFFLGDLIPVPGCIFDADDIRAFIHDSLDGFRLDRHAGSARYVVKNERQIYAFSDSREVLVHPFWFGLT